MIDAALIVLGALILLYITGVVLMVRRVNKQFSSMNHAPSEKDKEEIIHFVSMYPGMYVPVKVKGENRE